MIDISTLTPKDEGRMVIYTDGVVGQELGRLKSWNENYMFVVFKCNDLWVDYLNYSSQSCNPKDLHFKHTDDSDKQLDVIFRKFSVDNEVIALFPQIPDKPNDWYSCLSYMHVGQHGASHLPSVMEMTKPITTFYGYRDLLAELIRIGYNLKVVDKQTAEHKKQRREELKKLYG